MMSQCSGMETWNHSHMMASFLTFYVLGWSLHGSSIHFWMYTTSSYSGTGCFLARAVKKLLSLRSVPKYAQISSAAISIPYFNFYSFSVVGFSNALFKISPDTLVQLGFGALFVNEFDKSALTHFMLYKSRRIKWFLFGSKLIVW